jgi:lysophospholipase L1-like esterase
MKRLVVGALAVITGLTTSLVATASAVTYNSSSSTTSSTAMQSSQTPGQTPFQPKTYFALGDSIAAGAGLPLVDNATLGDIRCRRSSQAYPQLVAANRGLTLYHLACSGATSDDVLSQLNTAFAAGTPELITITVGANDANWVDYLRQCYSSNCDTTANTAAIKADLVVLQGKLQTIFQTIQTRSSNGLPPQVVMTGYSNPVSNYCIGRQNYATKSEIKWLNARRDDLNKTIRSVVNQYTYASYASTNFDGHALCASDSWVQQISDPAPLHPTAQGQQLITTSVLGVF